MCLASSILLDTGVIYFKGAPLSEFLNEPDDSLLHIGNVSHVHSVHGGKLDLLYGWIFVEGEM